ncbi:MAG: efflux RND transporter permease subunit [Tindallia sp. MSAO_Bac2]|nr:MAG: efflux RND transporter permease subunit [Tindallia sp. MSAO_Bac2]
MTRFLEGVLRRRLLVFLLVLMITIAGIISYYTAPKQEYPEIAPPMALITAQYPGALPEDVERLVTRKIEEEVESINGFIRSDSRSVAGMAIVVLELEYGTDIDEAWRDLRNQMGDLQQDLPEEAETIQVNTKLDETAGFILAITSPILPPEQMMDLAEELKFSLSGISGLARLETSGEQEYQIGIQVDSAELNQLPLSMDNLLSIVEAQSATIPLGEVAPSSGDAVGINLPAGFEDIESLKDLVILSSPETSGTLRLGGLASIGRELIPDQPVIRHYDDPAVLVSGYFAEGHNALFTGREVKEAVAVFEETLPEEVAVEKLLFQPDDISRKVNEFTVNLLQGMLFVIIVVFLGLGFRNSLVVSSAIPLSILMTMGLLRFVGIQIHQISITALIIALGMLVDNAIVVSDAIQVRLDREEDIHTATVQGTRDVTAPVFSSTLTTVGAFLPLLFLDSLAGDFIRSVPQIVMMALASSYLISVVFVPTAARLFFQPRKKRQSDFWHKKMYSIVDSGLRRPRFSLVLLLLMVVVTVALGTQLGLQFFPKADTDMVYVDIHAERDLGMSHTEKLTEATVSILQNEPEITSISTSVGDGFPKFYNTLPLPLQARDYSQVMLRVDLESGGRYRRISQLTDDIQRRLDRELVGGRGEIKQLELADPIGAPVIVRISGGEQQDRQKASYRIQEMLNSIPGTINVRDDHEEPVYEYQIEPEDETARRLGISRYDIARELNLALMGQTVTNITLENRETDIFLESDLDSITKIENFGISSSGTGEKTALHQIARVSVNPQPPTIRKYNSRETISVYSDAASGYNAVNIQNQLEDKIEAEPPANVSINYAGEKQEIIKYFGEVGISGAFAVMIVFLILVIQFGNLRLPLLILLTIPFSALGSVVGLWVFRQPLSFTALLGMVSLFGIVVNNAIILLDYIQSEERKGYDAQAACREAVALRIRPILLTTVTTVMGLMPLIFSRSDLFTPMAISLMAGLLVSAFLTLVILPILYQLTERKKSS